MAKEETGFKPTRAQRRADKLLSGPQVHTCLVGGGRSGKTFEFVRAICHRCVRAPGSRHLIARFRYNHVKASIGLDTLLKVMKLCFPGAKLRHAEGVYYWPNGSEIWLAGLDEKARVDKVLGTEFATIFLNEASQIPYSSVLVVRTRLAQNVPGLRLREYVDLNPVGLSHWTNKEFGEGKNPLTNQPLQNPSDYQRMFINPEDNAANLPQQTLELYRNLPGRYRKRFYEGQYVPEIDNAFWTIEQIERCRVAPSEVPKTFKRMVVAVDPSGTRGKGDKRSNHVGIVVAGLADDGRAYVLADLTCDFPPGGKRLPPDLQEVPGPEYGWGGRAVWAYRKWNADHIVGESNFGGDMVRSTIHTVDPRVPYREAHASRGKAVRAEPVSACYPQDKVRHAGLMPELEEQMINMSPAGYAGEGSPDRLDAMVWALTVLLVVPEIDHSVAAPIQVAISTGEVDSDPMALGRRFF